LVQIFMRQSNNKLYQQANQTYNFIFLFYLFFLEQLQPPIDNKLSIHQTSTV